MSSFCPPDSIVNVISTVSGVLSLGTWLIAQFPQCYEIYQTKSVDGISPIFITIWIVGDLANLIGCILTNQLFFQYILATYFLACDFLLVGQFWYYGYYLKKHKYHKHHHHHHHHRVNGLVNSASTAALVIASNVGQSTALPILMSDDSSNPSPIFIISAGTVIAWFGSACYFFARIPQLIKNYERKSTEDISPFLFGCTLFGNITYTMSILFSCQFIYGSSEESWRFFINELPFIIGSGGTIIFDIFYFYQLWLYSGNKENNISEETPLLTTDN
ncbi:hypothetical protein WICMUC_003623 [Wickerhamomyces mucosus]|uniref:Uncharacterized protein n=1 Tax=Wickerhamomyces mucosus TaxID=1378264 RepID=A0A9P8PK10_9ASCO|nr:hypothetical protein WICMUC_003623 [Wickerhamomyces mucosus]